MSTYNLTRVTEFAQSIISQYLHPGDIAVDCTMGNGYDTLFLAKLIGEEGKVISFDVQKVALEKTRLLLEQNKVLGSVVLVNDSHENVEKYIDKEISAAMFNLGYLPGESSNIATNANSTLSALKKCLEILKPKGVVSLVLYYGHQEGFIEKNSILQYVSSLDSRLFHVIKTEYINQKNNPPIIITIIKKKFSKNLFKSKEVRNEKG